MQKNKQKKNKKTNKQTKKERAQNPIALIKQAWPMKDLLYGFTVNNSAQVMGYLSRPDTL